MFGRDYLFPEDWNKDVVPAVEALQQRSGLEFTDPVPVNTLPEAEYAAKVAGFVFGPGLGAEWQPSIPRWRALGLVDGDPTVESVNGIVQRVDAGVLRSGRPADLPQRQRHRSVAARRDARCAGRRPDRPTGG